MKEVSGIVRILDGKSFGFVDDVFIHPSLINRFNWKNQTEISGDAIKTYNKSKSQWQWKLI
jgi:hypothetical protein